jgi:hypothetical protein
MNYAELANQLTPKVMEAVATINNPEISPEVRQLNQEILLKEVGQTIYDKIYNMNAFDFEITHTKGPGIDDRHFGLAKVASNSVSNGTVGLEEYIQNYLTSMASKAQQDAFKNAKQSNKFPTVKRTESAKACPWCQSKTGTFTDPPADVFKRHGGCQGKIITEGYKSRNGLLQNYKSSPDNKAVLSSGGLRTENAAQKAMEDALNAGNVTKAQQIVDSIQDPGLKTGLQSTIDNLQGQKGKFKVDPVTKKIIPA